MLAEELGFGQGDRVDPVEAGAAQVVRRDRRRRDQSLQRDEAQGVGTDRLAHLLDRAVVRRELAPCGEVDAVEAGPGDRGAGDAHVDLGSPGLAQHLHDGPLGVPAHDRVVDDDQPLALDDLAQRVELEPDTELADRLRRLDEGPPHVGVLHQTLRERDPAGLRVADGGGRARLRGRDHQVGLDRVLPGQDPADLDARRVHAAPVQAGVRTREVDVLEQAALGLRGGEALATDPPLVDRDNLAGLDVALVLRTDDVQRGRLRGDHPAAEGKPAQDQRPDPLRIAGRVEGVVVHEDEAEGAAHSGQLTERRGHQGLALVGGEERGQQLGVGGGVHRRAERQRPGALLDLGDPLGQQVRVGEIAVVRQGDVPGGRAAERGLGVLPDAAAGGGVAACARSPHAPAAKPGPPP